MSGLDSAVLERAQTLLYDQQLALRTEGRGMYSLRPYGRILVLAQDRRTLLSLVAQRRDDPGWALDVESWARVAAGREVQLRAAVQALADVERAALLSSEDAWLRQEVLLWLGCGDGVR